MEDLNDRIKYDGKGCPVDTDSIVTVWFNNVFTDSEAGESGEFDWRINKSPRDIIFYRVNSEDKKNYDGNGQPVSDDTSVRVWWKGGNWEVHLAGNIFWPRIILNHTMDLEFYQILKRGGCEAKSNNSFVGSKSKKSKPPGKPGKPGKPVKSHSRRDFIKYEGNGRPVLKDDYIEVKLVSGEKINGHGCDFSWWKNIDGMDRGDLQPCDIAYYRIKGKPLTHSSNPPFKIPFDMKMTDKATSKDWRYNDFRIAGWNDKQLLDEGFMIKSDEFCLGCGKQMLNDKGVEINGDIFHTDCTPEGDPDYSKITPTPNVRDFNIGDSNYAQKKIQPWDIWLEYDLNPWDADVVKRILRDKESQSRKMDYEKIIHVCQERIRQINEESDKGEGAEHF